MRTLAKQPILAFISFIIVSYFYPGFTFDRVAVLVVAGLLFGLLSLTVKPILGFFSLPLNLFTFGLFSFISGAVLIYLVSVFVDGFSIIGFQFSGLEVSGFTIPSFWLIPLVSAIFGSVLIGWFNTIIRWIFH